MRWRRLAALDARESQVVELRFFGGLTVEETGRGARRVADDGDARLEFGEDVAPARTGAVVMTPAKMERRRSPCDHDSARARAPIDRAGVPRRGVQGRPGAPRGRSNRCSSTSLVRDSSSRQTTVRRRSPVNDAVRRVGSSLAPGRLAGAAVGAYQLESLIGAGGMGEVYRARDTRLDRDVAIKMLPALPADRGPRAVRARGEGHLHPEPPAHLHAVRRRRYRTASTTWSWSTSRARRSPTGSARARSVAEASLAIQIADALDQAHRAASSIAT